MLRRPAYNRHSPILNFRPTSLSRRVPSDTRLTGFRRSELDSRFVPDGLQYLDLDDGDLPIRVWATRVVTQARCVPVSEDAEAGLQSHRFVRRHFSARDLCCEDPYDTAADHFSTPASGTEPGPSSIVTKKLMSAFNELNKLSGGDATRPSIEPMRSRLRRRVISDRPR